MAVIDERLTGLTDALLRSPLAPLITEALTRLEAAERELPLVDGDHDPLAPAFTETLVQRALRQLKALDSIVTQRINLELGLMERSLSLARELNSRTGDRGPEAFATVMVIGEAPPSDASKAVLEGENLLTGARRERLQTLLKVWLRAVDVTKRSIDGQEG